MVPSHKSACRHMFLKIWWYLNGIHLRTYLFWCMSMIIAQNKKLTELSAPERKFNDWISWFFSFFQSLKYFIDPNIAPHTGFDTLSRKQHNYFHINSFPFIETSFVLKLEPKKREIPISPIKIGNSHFFIYLLNARCLMKMDMIFMISTQFWS